MVKKPQERESVLESEGKDIQTSQKQLKPLTRGTRSLKSFKVVDSKDTMEGKNLITEAAFSPTETKPRILEISKTAKIQEVNLARLRILKAVNSDGYKDHLSEEDSDDQ